MMAVGEKFAYDRIKGFDEAWADVDSSFYVQKQHPSWKTSSKTYRWNHNFYGGDAYFVIPKFPILG